MLLYSVKKFWARSYGECHKDYEKEGMIIVKIKVNGS